MLGLSRHYGQRGRRIQLSVVRGHLHEGNGNGRVYSRQSVANAQRRDTRGPGGCTGLDANGFVPVPTNKAEIYNPNWRASGRQLAL